MYPPLSTTDKLRYNYKYNGKELQDELGLNWDSFKWRNYDYAIARFMSIDPLAENSRRWSPYNYAYNNPIYFIDPDGMQAYPPSEQELMDNFGLTVDDIADGYTHTDSDGSWKYNKENKTWEGQGDTDVNIPAETVQLQEVVITKTTPVTEQISNFFSNKVVGPFLEVGQDIAFPIINQVNIIANEGPHEGGAYNRDNILLPKTYEFNNWSFDDGKTITGGNISWDEGKEKLKNVVSVVPLAKVNSFSTVIENFIATQLANAAIKTPIKEVINQN